MSDRSFITSDNTFFDPDGKERGVVDDPWVILNYSNLPIKANCIVFDGRLYERVDGEGAERWREYLDLEYYTFIYDDDNLLSKLDDCFAAPTNPNL
jgi:hypothetical protein